jgi:hypothetical protein
MGQRKLTLWVIIALFGVANNLNAQNNSSRFPYSITLNPDFQETVEPYISEIGEWAGLPEWVYNNRIFANAYENDKLVLSTKDSANMDGYFSSFYYWEKDTLVIEGTFGLRLKYGFSVKIYNGKANFHYLLLAPVNDPQYASSEKGPLDFRLEVPCSDVSIILTELPDPELKYTVYGYVKFKSGNYYESRQDNFGKETDRVKKRTDMKIYFRSDYNSFD